MRCLCLLLLLLLASPVSADDRAAALVRQVQGVGPTGQNSTEARAAWDKLVALGPAALPPLLDALSTPDVVVANWLRAAFDRIVETEVRAGGRKIDRKALRAVAEDAKRPGRARRLALDVLERLSPGERQRLVGGWLNDPEFRHDAVAQLLKEADDLAKADDKPTALALYRKAFDASRDLAQARTLASRLAQHGVSVSVADHLGFLRDWYVIGPFDAAGMKGFKTAYPPEEKVDLGATVGELRWKRYHVNEPPPAPGAAHVALVDLREPLGDAADAVGYAYTRFYVPLAVEVEFRGAADDNMSVWVNGERVFGFEEYRNGVRMDRHRFRAKLKAGNNSVLVKVCQAPTDPTSPEPNWEFLLRVVHPEGWALPYQDALPRK